MIPFLPRLQQAIAEATPGPWHNKPSPQSRFMSRIALAPNATVGNLVVFADARMEDASLIVLLANAAPEIAAALEAAKGSVTALDALWEQDCDYEPTKWGRNINCARCAEGVRGFHDDTAHWADVKHKGDCIYAHGRSLREALAALDGGAP